MWEAKSYKRKQKEAGSYKKLTHCGLKKRPVTTYKSAITKNQIKIICNKVLATIAKA